MNIINHIGNTPLVKLKNIGNTDNSSIYAKLEMFNPTGSIKDRVVLHMIKDAEEAGLIKPGDTLVEASSGNTGAALAFIAKQKKYKAVITTPNKTSKEKIKVMELLGASVHVCPSNVTEDDSRHYIRLARAITSKTQNAFMLDQYNRQSNVDAHYSTTGPEIWRQTQGNMAYLVACSSSGGTISGAGQYLKEQNPELKLIMPDPYGSVYYHYFHTGEIDKTEIQPYQIEGVGKDLICGCCNFEIIDDVVKFDDELAINMIKRLASEEGILAGGSSGAAVAVAEKLILSKAISGNVVVILPDTGLKYLSKFF